MNRSFPELFAAAMLFSPSVHAEGILKVRTTKPEAADAVARITAVGRTFPSQEAVIYARATGTVSERKVDIGDRVKKGDVLLVISAPEIAHQLDGVRAKMKQMEAKLELASVLEARGEELAGNNAFSKEQLDERRSGAKIAGADLLSARAELKQLEEIDGFLTVRAPFDGTITGRRIDVGDRIKGDSSSSEDWLYQMARLDELKMVLGAPPASALFIHQGEPAEITFADLPGRSFRGKVARSSGVIDSGSGTMRIELVLPNPDLVLPAGLSGVANISSASQTSVATVPSNAILMPDGVPSLALVEENKVRFLSIKLGRTLGAKTEVLSGLKMESEVILSPNALLREGDVVERADLEPEKKGS